MSETQEITGPLVSMIRQMGIFCERMNSGKIKTGRRWIYLHSPGTADILCFPQGRVVWLECKQPKGRTHREQIDSQEAFKERVESIGHEYARITSIDEGLEKVR